MSANLPSMATAPHKSVQWFEANASLSAKELKEFKVTSFLDLQRSLSYLQNQQQNSRTMMYMKRLHPFLDAMGQHIQNARNLTGISEFSGLLWASVQFLLLTTSVCPEAFNLLLGGYFAVGERLGQLLQSPMLLESDQYIQFALPAILEDLLETHGKLVAYFKQRSWSFLPTLLKSLYADNKTPAWIDLFQANRKYLERAFSNLRDMLYKQLRSQSNDDIDMGDMQAFRQNLRSEHQRSQEDQLNHRRIQVKQWLCPIDSELRHEDILRILHPGTGEWFLRDHIFQKWSSLDYCANPLLWLNGKPGAGKTVLASLVVEKIRAFSNSTVVFFYCKHNDEHRNGFVSVARALLSQLAGKNDYFVNHLFEQTSTSGQVLLSTADLAKKLLETGLKSCDKTYIVLDGLDEYARDDRKEISSWFRSLVQSLPRTECDLIRCLFVSQDDGYARKDLGDLPRIKVGAAENTTDIQTFCRHWHEKVETKFGRLEKQEHDISRIVVGAADGMFLFARLVILNLFEQANRNDLEKELHEDTFPKGLEQAYARILKRILEPASLTQSGESDIKKLLGWLVCARRPLKWYEIQGAMSIDLERQTCNPKRSFKEECKCICASLVEINSDETVVLVHATAKKYLTKESYVNQLYVECDLAILCLEYLTYPQFDIDRPCEDVEKELFSGFYAFCDYAVAFWATHLEVGIQELNETDPNRFGDLTDALEHFLETRCNSSSKEHSISKTLQGKLLPLQTCHFYAKAYQAIMASEKHLRATGKGLSDDDVLGVSKSLCRIRKVLEGVAANPTLEERQKETIIKLYGPNWFKCPRVNCKFFHEGFPTAYDCSRHNSKHERAFTCVEEGCPQSILGCTTAKELKKHMLEFHGTYMDRDNPQFPKDETTQPSQRNLKHPATHQCPECPKRFTRAHTLRSHLRTHTDERPFVCTICRKAFHRENDRKRHEKIHGEERGIICGGLLKSGRRWGCERRFTRPDALRKHFQSEAGRECIRMYDEGNQLVCHGVLKNGEWGCGGHFASVDALAEHFGSEAGHACMKPLLEQAAPKSPAPDESTIAQHLLSASPDSIPGLAPASLNHFKSVYGASAFTCRFHSCPRAVHGFSTAAELAEHESTGHELQYTCTDISCEYNKLGFASARALKQHLVNFHPEFQARKVPVVPRPEVVVQLAPVAVVDEDDDGRSDEDDDGRSDEDDDGRSDRSARSPSEALVVDGLDFPPESVAVPGTYRKRPAPLEFEENDGFALSTTNWH